MYLFNPDNDLAIANFMPNYTPPASATRLEYDLAMFPIWYSSEENIENGKSLVIAEGDENHLYLNRLKGYMPLKSILIPYSDIALYPNNPIIPWGWNPSLVRRLRTLGANDNQLPSIDYLNTVREYSNRRHAVEVLNQFKALEPGLFAGDPHFFTDIEDVLSYLRSFHGDKLLKMPLSGSGKGLVWILGDITDKQCDWCRKVIRGQGGIVAEPVVKRVKDFAMEFYIENGNINFMGYSLFRTATSGAYMGNELLSDNRIEDVLSNYTSPTLIQDIKTQLLKELPQRFPRYRGYAGVDMMVCDTPKGNKIHPCVEINMRMNMGMVSRIIHNQFIHPRSEGVFMVDYFKKTGKALSFHFEMERNHPLEIKTGRVSSGYLSLTPVTADTNYSAYIIVYR